MSIRTKLLSLIVVSTLSATLIVTGVAVWRDSINFTEGRRVEVEATARVFASAAAEAVQNGQRGDALRVLRAIAGIPGIVSSSIVLPSGRVFAQMGETVVVVDGEAGLPGPLAVISLIQQKSLTASVPVMAGPDIIGTLVLVADTSMVARNALISLRNAAIAAVIAILVGFLLAFRIQRSITGRIGSITASMDHIRMRHDYRERVAGGAQDELGTIATAFNAMLDEIEVRDERLAEHRRHLEREVAERTQDYRIAKDNADAANAAKSDFLATMSHEIRTPMNGILVMAELLAASDLQPKQKRFADVIARSGGSLLAIINDILDFSKIEAGKIELETIPVILDDIIETVAQLFEEKARSKGLDLATHIAPSIPARIGADPVRLNQVLSNLVNNALKFTESGAVNLRAARDPDRPANMLFSVEDTGIGIAADKVDKVFDAFSQADEATTRRFGGTGLGLAICKRLVDAMGGKIFLESTPGVGTTFHVSVPIIHVDRLETEKTPRRLGPGRVLIAVSGQATKHNLARYLEEFGFDVADPVADTLQPASGDIRLVIADAELLSDPGIRPLLRRAPTLAIGTFGDAEIDRVIDQGIAQGQLIKPLARRELWQAIADVMAGNQVRRSGAQQVAEVFARYPERRVLVADDNPVNREVIIETLRRFDLPCDTVVDGRAAIESVRAKRYDLVLMDGSMPDIDGFEATRQIRAWEKQESRPPLPIVALTAHVIGTHADAWKTSGMNGVLHKPFTLQAMAAVLEKHLSGVRTVEPPLSDLPAAEAAVMPLLAPASPAAEPAPMTAAAHSSSEVENDDVILEPAITRQLLDMAAIGGHEAVARIYRLYLDNGPPARAEIDDAIARADQQGLGKAAHALKSMSLSIGARQVAAAAGELERAARIATGVPYPALQDQIARELDRAYAVITQLMADETLDRTEPRQAAVA